MGSSASPVVGGVQPRLPLVELLRAHALVHRLVGEVVGGARERVERMHVAAASPSGRRARPGSSRSAPHAGLAVRERLVEGEAGVGQSHVDGGRAARPGVQRDAVDRIERDLDDRLETAATEPRRHRQGDAAMAVFAVQHRDHREHGRARARERPQHPRGGGGERDRTGQCGSAARPSRGARRPATRRRPETRRPSPRSRGRAGDPAAAPGARRRRRKARRRAPRRAGAAARRTTRRERSRAPSPARARCAREPRPAARPPPRRRRPCARPAQTPAPSRAARCASGSGRRREAPADPRRRSCRNHRPPRDPRHLRHGYRTRPPGPTAGCRGPCRVPCLRRRRRARHGERAGAPRHGARASPQLPCTQDRDAGHDAGNLSIAPHGPPGRTLPRELPTRLSRADRLAPEAGATLEMRGRESLVRRILE